MERTKLIAIVSAAYPVIPKEHYFHLSTAQLVVLALKTKKMANKGVGHAVPKWFAKLSRPQQKKYLKDHPNSKLARRLRAAGLQKKVSETLKNKTPRKKFTDKLDTFKKKAKKPFSKDTPTLKSQVKKHLLKKKKKADPKIKKKIKDAVKEEGPKKEKGPKLPKLHTLNQKRAEDKKAKIEENKATYKKLPPQVRHKIVKTFKPGSKLRKKLAEHIDADKIIDAVWEHVPPKEIKQIGSALQDLKRLTYKPIPDEKPVPNEDEGHKQEKTDHPPEHNFKSDEDKSKDDTNKSAREKEASKKSLEAINHFYPKAKDHTQWYWGRKPGDKSDAIVPLLRTKDMKGYNHDSVDQKRARGEKSDEKPTGEKPKDGENNSDKNEEKPENKDNENTENKGKKEKKPKDDKNTPKDEENTPNGGTDPSDIPDKAKYKKLMNSNFSRESDPDEFTVDNYNKMKKEHQDRYEKLLNIKGLYKPGDEKLGREELWKKRQKQHRKLLSSKHYHEDDDELGTDELYAKRKSQERRHRLIKFGKIAIALAGVALFVGTSGASSGISFLMPHFLPKLITSLSSDFGSAFQNALQNLHHNSIAALKDKEQVTWFDDADNRNKLFERTLDEDNKDFNLEENEKLNKTPEILTLSELVSFLDDVTQISNQKKAEQYVSRQEKDKAKSKEDDEDLSDDHDDANTKKAKEDAENKMLMKAFIEALKHQIVHAPLSHSDIGSACQDTNPKKKEGKDA